ncbi:MAG TPA: phospholipase D-like domain-containing protein [Gemmatimonadaceae bacterium]|nr:phospholipase D-like domain-containing protein [Gemmatimonadaceae bacterium]
MYLILTVVVTLIVVAAAVFVYVTASVNAEADREAAVVSVPRVASDADAFMRALGGSASADVIGGNKITLLKNGIEIFPALLDAIKSARHSVHFSTFIYSSGHIPVQFADAFSAAAKRGVEVRMVFDKSGSKKVSPELMAQMRKAGCKVKWFRPIKWYSWAKYNHRTHRKLLIIDGTLAFTGGVGIADEWDGNGDSPAHWRDTHVHLLGPAVASVQAAFVDNWNEATGELPIDERYFPRLTSAGETSMCGIQSNPVFGASSAQRSMAVLIAGASRRLWIANAYFVPPKPFVRALRDAKARGVDVKILLPGRYHDQPAVRRASRRTWGPLLEGDVELYEYEPTMMHCKIVIVDSSVTSIGSINFDPRSFALNAEFGVVALDLGIAKEMEDAFVEDLRFSRRVTAEDLRSLPLHERLLNLFFYWIRAQL